MKLFPCVYVRNCVHKKEGIKSQVYASMCIIYLCVHMWRSTHSYVCEEGEREMERGRWRGRSEGKRERKRTYRGRHSVFSIPLHLVFGDWIFHWTQSSLFCLDSPALSPQDAPSRARIIDCTPAADLLVCWGIWTQGGSCACTAITLPTESSPQLWLMQLQCLKVLFHKSTSQHFQMIATQQNRSV